MKISFKIRYTIRKRVNYLYLIAYSVNKEAKNTIIIEEVAQ